MQTSYRQGQLCLLRRAHRLNAVVDNVGIHGHPFAIALAPCICSHRSQCGCGLGFRDKIIHHVIAHVLCMQQPPVSAQRHFSAPAHNFLGTRRSVTIYRLSASHICPLRSSSQSVCFRIAFECHFEFGVTPVSLVRDREVPVVVPAHIHIRPLQRGERGECQADCICLRLRIP